jgi:hypothetical protein
MGKEEKVKIENLYLHYYPDAVELFMGWSSCGGSPMNDFSAVGFKRRGCWEERRPP